MHYISIINQHFLRLLILYHCWYFYNCVAISKISIWLMSNYLRYILNFIYTVGFYIACLRVSLFSNFFQHNCSKKQQEVILTMHQRSKRTSTIVTAISVQARWKNEGSSRKSNKNTGYDKCKTHHKYWSSESLPILIDLLRLQCNNRLGRLTQLVEALCYNYIP